MKILITGGLGHIGSYLIENIGKIKFVKKFRNYIPLKGGSLLFSCWVWP